MRSGRIVQCPENHGKLIVGYTGGTLVSGGSKVATWIIRMVGTNSSVYSRWECLALQQAAGMIDDSSMPFVSLH